MFVNRYSARASSLGVWRNGADSEYRISLCGTFLFGSPSSCASLQTTVAGSLGFHRWFLGPVDTPPMGVVSASGSVTNSTVSAARVQISTERANRLAGTLHDHGGTSRSTRRWRLSGAPVTRA